MIIVRLRDMGCVQNALPVATRLHDMGLNVTVHVEAGGMAEKQGYSDEHPFFNNRGGFDQYPSEAVVVSCLPLEDGYDDICKSGNPVILIPENSDPSDERLLKWLDGSANVIATCALVELPLDGGIKQHITGLPAVDVAATAVIDLDRETVCKKIGISPSSPTASMCLPGTETECMSALDQVLPSLEGGDIRLVATSHPKLANGDPEGFKRVAERIRPYMPQSLEEANVALTPTDLMCLAARDGCHFLVAHNSTMSWQAAAAGVMNVQVLPPPHDIESWKKQSPIITSGLGRVFDGTLEENHPNQTLLTEGAAMRIASVVAGISVK